MIGSMVTLIGQVILAGASAYGVAYGLGGVKKALDDVGTAWGSEQAPEASRRAVGA